MPGRDHDGAAFVRLGTRRISFFRSSLIMGAALVGSVALFVAPRTAQALPACFSPDGTINVFTPGKPVRQCTVPAGVTRMNVSAWGAQGGDSGHHAASTDHGGAGGYSYRRGLPVTPGATLFVVGGQAGGNSDFTVAGDAGGGGSSGVYTTYPARDVNDVIVIAGGGGGAGCDDGGWGGGSFAGSGGAGGQGFFDHICGGSGKSEMSGHGGHGGIGGAAGKGFTKYDGQNGFGGSGGESQEGGYGGWGGTGLTGNGGDGIYVGRYAGAGGGGAGGYGGGGGGWGAGGGGGGSYPGVPEVSPNWGNGRVQMGAVSARSRPVLTIVKGPRALTAKRRASFRFRAGSRSRYQCKVNGHRVRRGLKKWRQCGARSPRFSGSKSYRGLRPGVKVFLVRVLRPDGTTGNPVRREWLITG